MLSRISTLLQLNGEERVWVESWATPAYLRFMSRARGHVIFIHRLSSFRIRDTWLQKAETGAAFWNNVETLKGEPSVGVSW